MPVLGLEMRGVVEIGGETETKFFTATATASAHSLLPAISSRLVRPRAVVAWVI